jgi:hypothetical protein
MDAGPRKWLNLLWTRLDAYYVVATIATVLLAARWPLPAEARPLVIGPRALWLLPLLLIPELAGWLVLRTTRRFFAWPWLCLAGLALALRGSSGSDIDQTYAYAGEIVILSAIILAELLGLSLGRWFNRAAALAYFAAAALWQLLEAWRSHQGGVGGDWHALTLLLGGLLFIGHALIQLVRLRAAPFTPPPPNGEAAEAADGLAASGDAEAWVIHAPPAEAAAQALADAVPDAAAEGAIPDTQSQSDGAVQTAPEQRTDAAPEAAATVAGAEPQQGVIQ